MALGEIMRSQPKDNISESIDNPEVLCDPETCGRPGHKNGFGNAISSHLAAIRTLSGI